MAKLDLWKRVCAVLLLLVAMAIASPAQTFTTLASFDKADGAQPAFASLAQGLDGSLYGTTRFGSNNTSYRSKGYGTFFRVTPGGTLTTLYKFCARANCPDGETPQGGVVLGTDGNFYGTTELGGVLNFEGFSSSVFKVSAGGVLTTYPLESEEPFSAPVQATNGSFYGTTAAGGEGAGTVFAMTPQGTVTTLYKFCSTDSCRDGSHPIAGLTQGTDENFYGTTSSGGAANAGTVFAVTTGGRLNRLHSFNTTDGADPHAELIQASDGNFYGTTELGGANGGGTVFQITPEGTLTTLHNFCTLANCADGETPVAGLVQATDGNLYGTTELGGANGSGTIFQITTGGTLATLYSFCAQAMCADGEKPEAGLVQGTDGSFYGAASVGGTGNVGTVFSLSMGLGPFVKTLPTFGNVGGSTDILGTNLTGATAVSFNGTPAAFTVVSATEITTTVPTGATTGFVIVTTPSGTLTSDVAFQVGR
jgi:uncharacterized repeat protein (TIGR03803 family)